LEMENYSSLGQYSQKLCEQMRHEYAIESKYYSESVKRGLRNSDGTGVIAGVSRIGSVHGYHMEDGLKIAQPGHLYYRGFDIEQIVSAHRRRGSFGYEEVAYLLLCGSLPNMEQMETFTAALAQAKALPAGFFESEIFKSPQSQMGTDIMNTLQRCVLALYNYDGDPDSVEAENVLLQSMALIARLPTIVAHSYAMKRHHYDNESLYIHNVKGRLSAAENFLRLIRRDKAYTDRQAKLLDALLMLHAEHSGGNNSAFTCRCVSSTGSDTYSAIAAAIGSLKGPLHGGANAAVMNMISDIRENVKNPCDDDEVGAYLDKILQKKANDSTGVIYGLGHAVYTISDPRARLIKDFIESLCEESGTSEEYEIAKRVERLGIPRLMQHKNKTVPVCANLDLYSGIVYSMLDIPRELYTPIFASARIAGWCAHRLEELMTGGKIMRPAYRIAIARRQYTAIEER